MTLRWNRVCQTGLRGPGGCVNLCGVLSRRCCRCKHWSSVGPFCPRPPLNWKIQLWSLNRHWRDGESGEEEKLFLQFCCGDVSRRSDNRGCISFEQLVWCQRCDFRTNKRNYPWYGFLISPRREQSGTWAHAGTAFARGTPEEVGACVNWSSSPRQQGGGNCWLPTTSIWKRQEEAHCDKENDFW